MGRCKAISIIKEISKINGMACENCAGRVEKALGALPGVSEVIVDLAAKTATVTYEPSRTDMKIMAAAIEDLGHGYEVA